MKDNILKSLALSLVLLLVLTTLVGDLSFAQDEGADEQSLQKQEIFIYDDKDKRDPFLRLVSESGVILNYDNDFLLKDLELEGVTLSFDGKSDLVIINGKVLKIGDIIGKFEVIKIDAKSVILKKGEYNFTLKLKEE